MKTQEEHLLTGLAIGLTKSKELFQVSTDARGGCKMLSEAVGKIDKCRCFLCLCDDEIAEANRLLTRLEKERKES